MPHESQETTSRYKGKNRLSFVSCLGMGTPLAPVAHVGRAHMGQLGSKVRGGVAGLQDPVLSVHWVCVWDWQPAVCALTGCQIDLLLNSTLLPSPAIIIKCV